MRSTMSQRPAACACAAAAVAVEEDDAELKYGSVSRKALRKETSATLCSFACTIYSTSARTLITSDSRSGAGWAWAAAETGPPPEDDEEGCPAEAEDVPVGEKVGCWSCCSCCWRGDNAPRLPRPRPNELERTKPPEPPLPTADAMAPTPGTPAAAAAEAVPSSRWCAGLDDARARPAPEPDASHVLAGGVDAAAEGETAAAGFGVLMVDAMDPPREWAARDEDAERCSAASKLAGLSGDIGWTYSAAAEGPAEPDPDPVSEWWGNSCSSRVMVMEGSPSPQRGSASPAVGRGGEARDEGAGGTVRPVAFAGAPAAAEDELRSAASCPFRLCGCDCRNLLGVCCSASVNGVVDGPCECCGAGSRSPRRSFGGRDGGEEESPDPSAAAAEGAAEAEACASAAAVACAEGVPTVDRERGKLCCRDGGRACCGNGCC